MKMKTRLLLIALVALLAASVYAQSHHGNWLRRNMSDTTIVHCWNDSLTTLHCPPNAMGMMMPDSMYCRTEWMPMDSLHHPHDSTMMGWCRFMLGSDSTHFNYMHCDSGSGHGGHHGMEFMRNLQCRMRWDSLRCDSTRRHWRPTGVRGWDGANWVAISGVSFDGNTAVFNTTQLYSAYAIVGSPSSPTSVTGSESVPGDFALQQNYPNPFNPSTTIGFTLPAASNVSVKIFNLLGQEVATLANSELGAGMQAVVWNGKDNAARSVASGLYFYKMTAAPSAGGREFTQVRKMLLTK